MKFRLLLFSLFLFCMFSFGAGVDVLGVWRVSWCDYENPVMQGEFSYRLRINSIDEWGYLEGEVINDGWKIVGRMSGKQAMLMDDLRQDGAFRNKGQVIVARIWSFSLDSERGMLLVLLNQDFFIEPFLFFDVKVKKRKEGR